MDGNDGCSYGTVPLLSYDSNHLHLHTHAPTVRLLPHMAPKTLQERPKTQENVFLFVPVSTSQPSQKIAGNTARLTLNAARYLVLPQNLIGMPACLLSARQSAG